MSSHLLSGIPTVDVTHNLLSILTNTLEGIAAIEQYKMNAQGDQEALQCFAQLEQQARQDVDELHKLVVSRPGS